MTIGSDDQFSLTPVFLRNRMKYGNTAMFGKKNCLSLDKISQKWLFRSRVPGT